mmetsp:Transcript_87404/g.187457  ORF Transcript_87404/g.187457 Transcript_87404/m.187457 type:complete len:206 (-) Transcript_87404:258-875(-)
MRKDEDLPVLRRRMFLDDLLKPLQLLVIDINLVRGVGSIPEDCGAQAHYEGLLGNLVAELRRLLAQYAQIGFEVLLVCGELVNALKVVVPADNVILCPKAVQVFLDQFEAGGRAREELSRLRAVLGLAQVSERNQEGAHRLRQDLLHMLAPLIGVVHVARINVQVAQDAQCEGRRVVFRKLELGRNLLHGCCLHGHCDRTPTGAT